MAGERVLVVEDNAVNRDVARGLLEGLGCQVDVAADGQEALEAWEQAAYDVVLMDCQMPGMDGFEATRRIRFAVRPSGRRVPIVALTADALNGSRERCLASGMDDYLTKPVSFALLRDAVERWTGAPGPDSA